MPPQYWLYGLVPLNHLYTLARISCWPPEDGSFCDPKHVGVNFTWTFNVFLINIELWVHELVIIESRLRVFENRVLRRIFGPKRDEVTGEWRKLHSEELSDLYSSPNIFRVVKSRRMWWVGHVALWGRGEVYTGFWWGNLKERDLLEDPVVDGRIILRWFFSKWDVGLLNGSSWLRIGHLWMR